MSIVFADRPGRVLVLAPHPDDETIGCGGTIVLHRRQGDMVKVVFVTDGSAGDPRRYYRGRDYPAIRRAEARRAASVLGASSLEFWDYRDGALADAAGLLPRLRDLLIRERPDSVYLPSADDSHPDHKALAAAFKTASGSAKTGFWDCRYEAGSMTKPRAAVDISSVFAQKTRALGRYRSQLRYCDYLKIVSRVNTCRGLLLPGARYAEAFVVRAQGTAPLRAGVSFLLVRPHIL